MGPTKVALVTASSAGLGAATAKGLARSGFSTIVNYNSSKAKAEQLVAEISDIYSHCTFNGVEKPHCIAIRADMSKKSDIYQLVKQVNDRYGQLDCVVSNQGWTQMRRFDDIEDNMLEDDWDQCYNMNVKSHSYVFHAAKPYLAESRGSFVTIASLAGVVPSGSSIVCHPTNIINEIRQVLTRRSALRCVQSSTDPSCESISKSRGPRNHRQLSIAWHSPDSKKI